jgi:hypothetical protein
MSFHIKAAEVVSVKEWAADEDGNKTWHVICRSQISVIGFRTKNPPKVTNVIEVEGERGEEANAEVRAKVMGLAAIAPRMRDRFRYIELQYPGAEWLPSKQTVMDVRRNPPVQPKKEFVLDKPLKPPPRRQADD